MTLTELRDKANAKLAVMWPVIQAKQDAYFAKYGMYFGFRWSPRVSVVDGVDTALEIVRPSRFHYAADITFSATDVPYQIKILRINQGIPNNIAPWPDITQPPPTPIYGPTGETYQVWVRVKLPNGDVWERNRMQDNTDSGWYQVLIPEPDQEPDPEPPAPWVPPDNPFPPRIEN